jgi:hypothetical protein
LLLAGIGGRHPVHGMFKVHLHHDQRRAKAVGNLGPRPGPGGL